MFDRILIALKPGQDTQPLLDLGAAVATRDTQFTLASIVLVGTEEDERQRFEAANQELAGVAGILGDEGRNVSTRVEMATVSAANGVIGIADQVNAELIVLGLHKRSRVSKALLGSDAQAIMLSAPCPVLTSRIG